MGSVAARAVIFDLDGTVWDSATWFASALVSDNAAQAALRDELVGGRNIVAALTHFGVSRVKLLQLAEARSGSPPIYIGMREAISGLAERAVPLGIATSLPGTIALPMLAMAGLRNSFAAVVHAGLCRAPKPSPASIQMALRLLEQEPGIDAFYVGDREVDRLAAGRAGVSFVWMQHGYERPIANYAGIAMHAASELLEL